ncbi:MAG: AAA family ATPase [Arcicella sp.]|jgi:chromosome partitioning protein|nr:AAA family ATPase [Arcicella sp.]
MAKVIAISNHKGGVGKTTSTVNIGAGIAMKGKKVLLIDLDPQANLTQCLGIIDPEETIYGALRGEYDIPIVKANENLFVTPSTLDLASVEMELSTKIAREIILKKMVEKVAHNFDFIFIDCPPSLGLITVNAFAAANEIFIPLQAQFLALHGLDKLTDIIALVKENLNPELKVGGVFITQYDSRKILNRDIAESVSDYFNGNIFTTFIRDNVALAEAPIHGIDIFRYDPKSNGAKDYNSLINEFFN